MFFSQKYPYILLNIVLNDIYSFFLIKNPEYIKLGRTGFLLHFKLCSQFIFDISCL